MPISQRRCRYPLCVLFLFPTLCGSVCSAAAVPRPAWAHRAIYAPGPMRKSGAEENKQADSLGLSECLGTYECAEIGIGAPLVCENNRCIPKSLGKTCKDNANCTTFTTCDKGTCRYGLKSRACTHVSNCAPRYTCTGNTCKPGVQNSTCLTALNCAQSFTCDTAIGKCIRGILGTRCVLPSNCESGLKCDASTKKCIKSEYNDPSLLPVSPRRVCS